MAERRPAEPQFPFVMHVLQGTQEIRKERKSYKVRKCKWIRLLSAQDYPGDMVKYYISNYTLSSKQIRNKNDGF